VNWYSVSKYRPRCNGYGGGGHDEQQTRRKGIMTKEKLEKKLAATEAELKRAKKLIRLLTKTVSSMPQRASRRAT
jgi:hypothetical protein